MDPSLALIASGNEEVRNCAYCLQTLFYQGLCQACTGTSKSTHLELLFLSRTPELKDRVVPPKNMTSNLRQVRKKDYLGDNLHPRCRYALSVPVAASNSPRYGGEGFIGLEENSGWN